MPPSIGELFPKREPRKGTRFVVSEKGAGSKRLKEVRSSWGKEVKIGEELYYPAYDARDTVTELWLQRVSDPHCGALISKSEDLFDSAVEPEK